MWSYYAEQHTGVVLKFRHIQDSAWGAAMPVAYTNEMPRLLEEDELINMFGGDFSIDPVEVDKRLVYTKAIDWAYEKEWRIGLVEEGQRMIYMKIWPLIQRN